MGWTFSIFPINIFELGTVTVSGVTDTGFPASRLYDRSMGFYWKATATEAKTFAVDQGADGAFPVDVLAVGFNNFAGSAMQWQHSNDGAAWVDAVPNFTPAESVPFVKALSAPVTARHWQLTLAAMLSTRCSEIFMGPAYTFAAQRSAKPSGSIASNVQWNRTIGGLDRSTKFGQTRRTRTYTVWLDEGQSELSRLLEAIDYLDDLSKPFFFRDHQDNYFWARFAEDPFFDFDHKDRTHLTLDFVEML